MSKSATTRKHKLTEVESQLRYFIEEQGKRTAEHYHGEVAQSEVQKLFAWTAEFASQYLDTRRQRATELQTPEILKSQTLAREYIGFGHHDFFATCVDGRNMPAVMFSRPPHVGGVLRSPAGVVTGFMEGQEPGTVFIDRSSLAVQQIAHLLEEKAGDTIFYGLDSHLGCAARGLIHSTEGGKEQDKGLRTDVRSKLMTARGIIELRSRLLAEGKAIAEVIPIFFSFDPHSGGVMAGLEVCIDDERVAAVGFTDEVLDQLAHEGKIVRTIDLYGEAEVLAELQKALKPATADFRTAFAQSMLNNWKAISALFDKGRSKTYQSIYSKLVYAYELAGWKIADRDDLMGQVISHRTLKQKSKFLLKNLVTRFSIAGVGHKWPYDSHREDLVVITDGGYAPFVSLDAFAVFSRDLSALTANTKLTLDLIRQFRRAGSAVNPVSSVSLTTEEFVSAPVLVSNKAIFRAKDDETWRVLGNLNWRAVVDRIEWDNGQTLEWRKADIHRLIADAFVSQPEKLPLGDALGVVDALYELFDRLRIMMKDKYFRKMILYGNIVVLNTIVDADRMPRVVIPWVI